MNTDCKTVFLQDVPTSSDQFESHGRLAKIIHNTIKNESVSKTIALTGKWGSGKSSVISILKEKEKLEANGINFIEFDAWEHEGESTTEEFLESLLDSLESSNWIHKDKWQETRDKLSKKLKVTNTKSIPVITKEGRKFIIATAASTVGILGLNKFNYATQNTNEVITWQNISFFPGNYIWILVVLLSIMAFSPILVLFYYMFWKSNTNIYSVFLNKTESTTHVETSEIPEPSSIEFQTDFNNIIKDVLIKDCERKLVIVIDNLDRLSQEDILKTWSTMRTFISAPINMNDGMEWKNRLWMLLPFDMDAIENKLQKSLTNSSDQNDKKKNQSNTQSLIDKTVQIRFDVPPPALSRWKQYMLELLKMVFPDHKNFDEFHHVYRVFLLYYMKKRQEELLTPRTIKLFINQIGSIHAMWGDTIPLSDQAFYATMKLLNVDVYEHLLDQKDSDIKKYSELLSPNHYNNIAALYLNVKEEEAIQIILGPKITIALLNGDIEVIDDLKEVSGFFEVLEKVMLEDKDMFEKLDNKLMLTAYSLSNVTAGTTDHIKSLEHVWSLLVKFSDKISDWEINNNPYGLGFVELLKKTTNKIKLLSNINGVRTFENDEVNKWLTEVKHIANYLDNKSDLLNIPSPVGDDAFLDFISYSDIQNHELIPYLASNVNMQNVEKWLINRISLSEVTNRDLKALNILRTLEISIGSAELTSTINNKVISIDSTTEPGLLEIDKLMKVLLVIINIHKFDVNLISTVKSIFNDGYVLNHFYNSWNNNYHSSSGILLCGFFLLSEKLTVTSNFQYSNNGMSYLNTFISSPHSHKELLNSLVRSYRAYGNTKYLFESIKITGEMAKFAELILSEMINDEEHGIKFLNADIYINNFPILYNLFKDNVFQKSDLIIQSHDFIEKLINDDFDEQKIHLYIHTIQNTTGEINRNFKKWIFNNLNNYNKDEWKASLSSKDNLNLLLRELLVEREFSLGLDYSDALHELIKEKGHLDGFVLKGELLRFFIMVDVIYKKGISQNLRQLITYSDNPITIILDELSDEIFSESVNLSQEYINQLVNGGLSKVLERKDETEIQSLVKILSLRTDIVINCSSDYLKMFIVRLDKRLEETEEGTDLRVAYFNLKKLINSLTKQEQESSQKEITTKCDNNNYIKSRFMPKVIPTSAK